MAYNFNKKTCDKCGITAIKAAKVDTSGMTYAQRMLAISFRLGTNGSVLCQSCHKERDLEIIFSKMEAK